jgi:hypothetical protein
MHVLRLQSSDSVGPSWDDVDELEQPSHFQQKTTLTIVFNGTGEYNIALLPAGQKINNTYFTEYMRAPLTEVRSPEAGNLMKKSEMLPFLGDTVSGIQYLPSLLQLRTP